VKAALREKCAWGRGNRGIAYPAVAGASFSGQYGLSFTQNFFGSEADGTGQMTVDTTADTLAVIVDTNSRFFAQPSTALIGSFQATAISGRLTGTLSNELFPSDLAVAYYLIDSDRGFFVETNSLDLGGVCLSVTSLDEALSAKAVRSSSEVRPSPRPCSTIGGH